VLNLSEAKTLSVFLSFFLQLKPEFRYSSLSFVRLSPEPRDRTADKLAINWQNFAQVELQLKFAF